MNILVREVLFVHVKAGKSNHGHLEGAAGFAGLMKAP